MFSCALACLHLNLAKMFALLSLAMFSRGSEYDATIFSMQKIFELRWGFGKILLLASIIICLKWCDEKSNLGRSSSWGKVKIEWMSQYRLAFELRTKLLNFQSVKNPSLSSWAYFELPGENVRIVLNLKSRIGWMKKQFIFCIFKVLAFACLWLYLWRVVW